MHTCSAKQEEETQGVEEEGHGGLSGWSFRYSGCDVLASLVGCEGSVMLRGPLRPSACYSGTR